MSNKKKMLNPSFLFAILWLAPCAGAATSLVPRRGVEVVASLIAASLTVVISSILLIDPVSGSFGYFYTDNLTRILTLTTSCIYLTSVAYSVFYINRIKEPFIRFRWYYCLLDLFAFTMLLALTVNDLGIIWLAIEGTTVASALLVAMERKRTSIESAWRYTLIVSAGLALSLFAVILVYYSQGTLAISKLLIEPVRNSMIMVLAVGFALIGYGTKAGIAPMHAWLPDAHSEAPSPVSALFSAVLLPTSIYAFVRIFILLQGSPIVFSEIRNLVLGFGIFTVLLASIIIGYQRDYKRMLAYSSMENMGVILVGFSLGGIGSLGAIIQIVAHAFAKSSAFYEAGNILVEYETTRMVDAQGVIGRLRSTGYLFILSCLSITGAPPFGVFLGEFLILSQAIQSGNLALAVLLGFAYIYNFIGLNRQALRLIFGKTKTGGDPIRDSVPTRHSPSLDASASGSKVLEIRQENHLSILIPLVNLVVSLVVGIYMFPAFLQAATGV
ncbi:MAG: proton-conducting transporter membrane subunit [Candidatus Nitrosopolaris sp.]